MHPALTGLLVGIVLGVVLTGFEYLQVKKQVEERAVAKHQKPQFEPEDRTRVMAVLRFSLLLPFGAALLWWLWSMMSG
jgi:hypothetical protein